MKQKITVQTTVHAPLEKVWEYWNGSEHIPRWAFASDDWAATAKVNDLREGGKFSTRMFAKDESSSFDFSGTYTTVIPQSEIAYTLDDDREVTTVFEKEGDGAVKIVQTFEMEAGNSEEMQRGGWQAFLDNFKKYTEAN